jgi:hypothetical protein
VQPCSVDHQFRYPIHEQPTTVLPILSPPVADASHPQRFTCLLNTRYPIGWWLGRRGTPWIVSGIQPPVLLRSTFVDARRRLVHFITCCAVDSTSASVDARAHTQNTADEHNNQHSLQDQHTMKHHSHGEEYVSLSSLRLQSSLRTSSPTAQWTRTDAVLETLHAIEPATHCFNLLVIATGPGMLSLLVAIAAVAALACLHLWRWSLDHRFRHSFQHTSGHDGVLIDQDGVNDECVTPAHAMHPLPMSCVAMLLLFNTIYLGVLMSTTGLGWAAWSASALNWVALGASCWWSWGSAGSGLSTRSTITVVDAPIALTEMLLPPEQHGADGDADVQQNTRV